MSNEYTPWHIGFERAKAGPNGDQTFVAPIIPVGALPGNVTRTRRSASLSPTTTRRTFLRSAVAGGAALAWPRWARGAAGDLEAVRAQIEKGHDEAVRRLQEWIRQPSIAAENKGVTEGCDLTMRLLRDVGFSQVAKVTTDGQPGIFATLDAGASRTVGLYFMYDVKQVDPAE